MHHTPKPWSLQAAARMLGATPADIPGLWNISGYSSDLTENQLLELADVWDAIGKNEFSAADLLLKISIIAS